MGLFMPDGIAELGNVLKDLFVDLEVIDTITHDLTKNSDEIHRSGFQKFKVNETAFGESGPGTTLGYHHDLAHQKVSDTISAVLADLQQFRDGLKEFAKAVDETDTQTEADMKRRHDAVLALSRAADFHHTHQTNHYYHPDAPEAGQQGGDADA